MTQTTSEEKFLRNIMNVTTGWRLDGLKNQEEALREIQKRCQHRLYEKERMPG